MILSLFLLTLFQLMSNTLSKQKCRTIMKTVRESCTVENGVNLYYDNDKLPAIIISAINSTKSCSPICAKSFQLTRVRYQTFSTKMHEVISNMVANCCDGCANLTVANHISVIHENLKDEDSTDFIYPVFGETSRKDLYDFHFIPVLKVQNGYFFSLRPSNANVMNELIFAVLAMWPLVVICLMLSIISGFIIWVIEKGGNKEDFPPSFRVGVFQGFWWSFVSMTTVGYGDKAPKSFLGRIFSVIWILLGITVCSIFTATLATDISNARTVSDAKMSGKVVGILKNRLEDVMTVIHHGAVPYELEYNHTVYGILELMDKVDEKELYGFLLNRDTFQYFSNYIKRRKDKYQKLIDRIHKNFMKTQFELPANSFSFGILVKDRADYEFFEKYFDNNHLMIDACHVVKSNNASLELKLYNSISSDQEVFFSFFRYCLISIGVISLIGIVFEIRFRLKKRTDNNSNCMSFTQIKTTRFQAKN